MAGDCSLAQPSALQRASPAERGVNSHSPSASVCLYLAYMSVYNSKCTLCLFTLSVRVRAYLPAYCMPACLPASLENEVFEGEHSNRSSADASPGLLQKNSPPPMVPPPPPSSQFPGPPPVNLTLQKKIETGRAEKIGHKVGEGAGGKSADPALHPPREPAPKRKLAADCFPPPVQHN